MQIVISIKNALFYQNGIPFYILKENKQKINKPQQFIPSYSIFFYGRVVCAAVFCSQASCLAMLGERGNERRNVSTVKHPDDKRFEGICNRSEHHIYIFPHLGQR